METQNLEGRLNEAAQPSERAQPSFREKAGRFLKNYAIDTSAKLAMWSPYMAALEASPLIGLDAEQILKVRATSALIDTLAARPYGKVLDWVREKCDAKRSPLRGYIVDTATMIGYYGTLYAGYLAVSGADSERILKGEAVGAVAAIIGARLFGKGLNKWRNYFGYKKEADSSASVPSR